MWWILVLTGVVVVVVWYFRRPAKVVRRFSNEDIDEILGRKPFSPVCMICRKPRCKNKNNHPRLRG